MKTVKRKANTLGEMTHAIWYDMAIHIWKWNKRKFINKTPSAMMIFIMRSNYFSWIDLLKFLIIQDWLFEKVKSMSHKRGAPEWTGISNFASTHVCSYNAKNIHIFLQHFGQPLSWAIEAAFRARKSWRDCNHANHDMTRSSLRAWGRVQTRSSLKCGVGRKSFELKTTKLKKLKLI